MLQKHSIPEVNEWVAIFHIVKFYIAKVMGVEGDDVRVAYLEQKPGEVFELKKRSDETVTANDIFRRKIEVSLQGKTGYRVHDLPLIRAHYGEVLKTYRKRRKVSTCR